MKRLAAAILGLALCAGSAATAGAQQRGQQQSTDEATIGRQVYAQLQQKGEIIPDSPYYAILNPIAQQIKRVADPQYQFPFNFILVHEKSPNAFAVPGGNVYVTDSLMTFVKNREELAGVLCHETSHDIHHDVVNNMAKDQRAATRTTIGAVLGSILLGQNAGPLVNMGANYAYAAQTQGYSREVETAADLKGSETCAAAGYNPWGMVWLFQQFQKADTGGGMEALSDHPRDDHRISDLETHFKADPQRFAHFNSDIATATPLHAPANTTGYAEPPAR
jgi:predicted Zn-dependent protease